MRFWRNVIGNVTLKIVTADAAALLRQLSDSKIVLYGVSRIDELTIQVTLSKKDYKAVESLLMKRCDQFSILSDSGIHKKIKEFARRPVLLFGVLIIIFFGFFLPSRILFVDVAGNTAVNTALILEKAADCGICFGVSRKTVRSERVKNMLIEQIPELEWVGINTDGCVATIQVAEKTPTENNEAVSAVSSIVAARDGIILGCTVIRGTPVCKTGQAVTEGELLVSGYTDCGICIQATTAKAEVLARTMRQLQVITPELAVRRGDLINTRTNYYLRIGKKLINFRKGSGIPDATCVKIYEENHLVLPGGFVFPVSLITEKQYFYELVPTDRDEFDWLEDAGIAYLKNQMISGQIIHDDVQLDLGAGVACLTGQYDCTEMIGQSKREEIIENYGYD